MRETKAMLRAKIAELEQELAHIQEVNTAVELLKAGGDPDGSFCIQLQSKVWPLIAHSLMVWFERSGAENYIEQVVDFDNPKEKASLDFTTSRGFFVLTLQKKFMKTPHEKRVEAENEVANIKKTMQSIMQVIGPEPACPCAGCACETEEVIRLLKEWGIEYIYHKQKPVQFSNE